MCSGRESILSRFVPLLTRWKIYRPERAVRNGVVTIHSSSRVGTTYFLPCDVTHSSVRNILEKRYNLSEATASIQASYLLAGSIILYPIVSYLVAMSGYG